MRNQSGVVLCRCRRQPKHQRPCVPRRAQPKRNGHCFDIDWVARSPLQLRQHGRWIAAPGEYVISTLPGGTYGSASGTSFSSPLVAGHSALLFERQAFPDHARRPALCLTRFDSLRTYTTAASTCTRRSPPGSTVALGPGSGSCVLFLR